MAHRALIFAAVFLVCCAPAAAQAPQRAPYVNGPVHSLLTDGDTLYVGGSFTAAGKAAGPLSLVSPADGRVLRSHTGFSGREPLHVSALLADGAGGWYAGGSFERVDGHHRGSIVHLLADGSVDEDFVVEWAGAVEALARHGSTLWIGGTGAALGGEAQAGTLGAGGLATGAVAPARTLGAVDATTGAVLDTAAPDPGAVDDLEVSGDRLYVAGAGGLVRLDAATGVRDQWVPAISGRVETVAARDGVVYAGGAMGAVALRESDASLVAEYAVDDASALAVSHGVVVVRDERTFAAFDAATGADRGWFGDIPPHGDGELAVAGSRLYVAGAPGGFAAFDLRDGTRVPWAPPLLGGRVRALAAGNGTIGVGGDPAALDGVRREGLAAFDRRTGAVEPFAPGLRSDDGARDDPLARRSGEVGPLAPDLGREDPPASDRQTDAVKSCALGREDPPAFDRRAGSAELGAGGTASVTALHRAGGVLYAGGSFQGNLAALDPVTGARLPFPQATSPVHALAYVNEVLYIGGEQGSLGGVPTDGLGAVALASGTVLPFAPALGCAVDALTVSGGTLHAGGCFGLRSYREQEAVPAPAIAGRPWTLLPDGAGGLWAAGEFAGGNVAHFDAAGGPQVDSPVTDGPVYALALEGTTLHLGGRFTRVQDAPRVNVGLVNLVGGSVAGFNPRPAGAVRALAPHAGGPALGGAFSSTWDATTGGLAVFGTGDPGPARHPKTRPATPRPTRPKGISDPRETAGRAARR